ncbi:ATP-binding protein [Streptomyces silvensis]|uniref:NB-ARC domain-containing protein n=1 Tax=Streptomyces silvensis TaxID=1765722 RepID=A0A0W7X7T3_9ACTN|nr:tetratricopeptide repeat protein [Streptomyces silvensis]KUF18674.1 hypothetical protein AT728_06315 [Streptomyces silvensis]
MLGEIPQQTNSFVGRALDLHRVGSALASHRMVTLTGMAGVGKSRLAVEAVLRDARAPRPLPSRTVRWVDLGQVSSAHNLLSAVASAAGFADHTHGVALDALVGWLSGKRMLLVLDACEHLVSPCAQLCAQLLDACPGLSFLATSRQALTVPGEVCQEVPPLPHDEARELFTDRAVTVAPALRTRTQQQDEHVSTICRLLDGVPLGLELAAVQLMYATLGGLAGQLGTDRDLLAAPTWPSRHPSLRLAIGWSHQLCAPLERLLWARLSVFPGHFDRAAARGVCAEGPLAGVAFDAALTGLLEKSVVRAKTTGLFRLPHAVRDYGEMWLAELEERAPNAARHAGYFLDLARSADEGWTGPGQTLWYRRIAAAHPDLCAAMDHFVRHEPGRALELAGRIGFIWSCCGHLREARAYLEEALRASPNHSLVHERATCVLGIVVLLQGDHDQAERIGRRCARVAKRSDDREGMLAAAYLLGITHLLQGDAARAESVVDAVLGDSTEPVFTSAFSLRCHLVKVFALTGLGRMPEAMKAALALRARCAARGERWTRAYANYQIALIALATDMPDLAVVHARAMLDGMRSLTDTFGIALGLDVLAAAAAERGQGETAALVSGAAQTCWASVGHEQRGTPELSDLRKVCQQTARASVGDDAFERALDRGAAAELGSVLTLVIEESPMEST